MTIIKEYQAKTGKVTVTLYDNGEYEVKHSNPVMIFATEWHKYRNNAIAHAQFLSRY